MQQFILQQNVERLKRALAKEPDEATARTIRAQLLTHQRELALLLAATAGVRLGPKPHTARSGDIDALREQLDRQFQNTEVMCMLVDPGPGLIIIDLNASFERVARVKRKAVIGLPMFEAFPDNPTNPESDNVSSVYRSFREVGETGHARIMDVRRYDLRNAQGKWEARYWRPAITPIFDSARRLAFIFYQVEPAEAPSDS